ncbi:unnamed protein product [Caenorhabditis bovis]|uniref:Uncharacterized protein n=1 Tax=Caenorhabditis bovis TaxID=2654633 RepID=A0A8S1EFJ8_9PELO|nr:unnamed protein product [Caenorhabditis bovis]
MAMRQSKARLSAICRLIIDPGSEVTDDKTGEARLQIPSAYIDSNSFQFVVDRLKELINVWPSTSTNSNNGELQEPREQRRICHADS